MKERVTISATHPLSFDGYACACESRRLLPLNGRIPTLRFRVVSVSSIAESLYTEVRQRVVWCSQLILAQEIAAFYKNCFFTLLARLCDPACKGPVVLETGSLIDLVSLLDMGGVGLTRRFVCGGTNGPGGNTGTTCRAQKCSEFDRVVACFGRRNFKFQTGITPLSPNLNVEAAMQKKSGRGGIASLEI